MTAPAVVCGWSLVSDLGNKTVWVGGTHVKATGVSADLQYQSGASSSLGITGADTSGSIGIDLSSRTGYTSALKLVFTFTSTRQLCGTNDFPGGSNPKRLVATA